MVILVQFTLSTVFMLQRASPTVIVAIFDIKISIAPWENYK